MKPLRIDTINYDGLNWFMEYDGMHFENENLKDTINELIEYILDVEKPKARQKYKDLEVRYVEKDHVLEFTKDPDFTPFYCLPDSIFMTTVFDTPGYIELGVYKDKRLRVKK